MLKYMTGRT